MAKARGYCTFNDSFFDEIMRSARVESMCAGKAQLALKVAQATAPVDTGDYKRRLKVEVKDSAHRKVYRVVGHDRKTMLIESRTGNLARALKAVRS